MGERIPSDETESLCPVCLRKISAKRQLPGDDIFLEKACEDHGLFNTLIWRGKPSMDEWQRPKDPVHPMLSYWSRQKGCPFDCGLCEAHQQVPCSVLLEVTDRCNLNCTVCFADSGQTTSRTYLLEKIAWLLERSMAAVGPSNLQSVRGGTHPAGRSSRNRGNSTADWVFLCPGQYERSSPRFR